MILKSLSLGGLLVAAASLGMAKEKPKTPTAFDRYINDAKAQGVPAGATPGAIWSPSAPLADLGRDLRSRFVNDLVTILVADRASAVASGNTKSSRQSSAKAGIASLGGATRAAGPLSRLAELSSDTQLDGQAPTSRETVLSTTLSARVVDVLPNGYLVLEGSKELQLNSERQLVTIRGIARPADLTPGNVVSSDRLAQLEVRINGKGVIADAIRRPFILYRILLGLLPF
jgi:flagellar L-ring protein FlgH